MNLTSRQQDLIFDCCFHCADEHQIKKGSVLVRSNSEAAHLCTCLQRALAYLDYIKEQDCPDELADITIARLKLAMIKESQPHKNMSECP